MSILAKGSELAADLAEPALDELIASLSDSEILKDVPVLGSVVKLAGIGKSISDRIFLAKVKRFVTAMDPATKEKAHAFGEKLKSEDADAERIAEVLVLALEAINDLDKAPMLAAIFTAFLLGEIDQVEFRRMTAAVDAAMVDDLLALIRLDPRAPSGYRSKNYIATMDLLRHTGLTTEARNVIVASGEELDPHGDAVTPLGKKFIKIMTSKK
jgi:hypothetical protein